MPNIIINIPLFFTGITISSTYIYLTRAQVVGNGFCSSVVEHWSSNPVAQALCRFMENAFMNEGSNMMILWWIPLLSRQQSHKNLHQ